MQAKVLVANEKSCKSNRFGVGAVPALLTVIAVVGRRGHSRTDKEDTNYALRYCLDSRSTVLDYRAVVPGRTPSVKRSEFTFSQLNVAPPRVGCG